MPSHYNGKRFFLTYAQHVSTKEALLSFFESVASLKYYCIAQEMHEDGNPHYHCCIEFTTHQRKPVIWLDHLGKHPNKQDPRNWNACITYTKKDGDFIESPGSSREAGEDIIGVCKSSSEGDWMVYCITNKISFQYARFLWDRYAVDFGTITDDSPVVGRLCSALNAMAYNPEPKTLILNGPSGCGKTTWAKQFSVKPALFVSHIDQLRSFRRGYHQSIIFDDVSIAHIPREAQIHLLDFENDRAIHCRHSTALIPAGTYKIFTCNDWPVSRGDEAIERRCRFVNVRLINAAMA